jgi:hypothetical protein
MGTMSTSESVVAVRVVLRLASTDRGGDTPAVSGGDRSSSARPPKPTPPTALTLRIGSTNTEEVAPLEVHVASLPPLADGAAALPNSNGLLLNVVAPAAPAALLPSLPASLRGRPLSPIGTAGLAGEMRRVSKDSCWVWPLLFAADACGAAGTGTGVAGTMGLI